MITKRLLEIIQTAMIMKQTLRSVLNSGEVTCSRFPSLETLSFKLAGIGAPRMVAAVSLTMPRWRATLTAVVIVAVAVSPNMQRTPYCSLNTCTHKHKRTTTHCRRADRKHPCQNQPSSTKYQRVTAPQLALC